MPLGRHIAHHALLKYAFLLLAAGLALAGCQDKISTLGAQYYSDTISTETSIRNDPGFIQFADTLRPFVAANGVDYGLNDSTTLMIIGKVNNPYPPSNTENLESWGFLAFPPLDSVNNITGVRLILKDHLYKYGDSTSATSSMVDLSVYAVYNAVFDAMDSFPTANPPNGGVLVGSIDTLFPDSTDRELAITLNQNSNAVIPLLTESFNAFVIIPKPTMTNARGFGTIHSYSDASSIPQMIYYLKNGNSVVATPTLDFHIVHDMSITPTNEFTLRGSMGKRERITLNLTRPTDTAQLNGFTTINNATLVLHIDPNNSSHSNIQGDTAGPDVVLLGTVDSADHYESNGYLDPTDPTNTTYRFQVRTLIEQWLRNPSQNLGFELRSGFDDHSFGALESIGVEDNTLNRWTFYGPNYGMSHSDSTKRPYFILSYSKLK